MAKRTYVPSLLGLATRMCRMIARATPIILATYPNNAALHAALSAANSACSVLGEELALVREYGD